MKKIPVIIDTDPGADDAIALIIALKNKLFDVKLITSVGGNSSLEKTTRNALFLTEFMGSDVPVAKGVEPKDWSLQVDAENVHGESGLGDLKNISPKKQLLKLDAVESMLKVLNESKEPITILTLGPLTNLAELIKKYPKCLNKIKCVYSMIGSIYGNGNITPYAEYNSYCNPQAFDVVLKSGLEIYLVPMESGEAVYIKKAKFYEHNSNNFENVINEIMKGTTESRLEKDGLCVYDASVVLSIIYPELFEFKKCDATVSTKKENYGQTFFTLNGNGKCNLQTFEDGELIKEALLKELYGE